ncbi:MAG: nucleotide excision repair endonuclease [Deltaproteobacteria bacterium]|nr:nucleotide excision repair endonuclease [Deltaproteobacteria bacterium]
MPASPRRTAFERKLGPDLLGTVPAAPGVYRWLDADGAVVYVGKAKDLRRRLAQYKNAGRARRDRKLRRVVHAAASLVWEVCESELAASLEEVRLIQALRPPLNVASAYAFLYPFIGVRVRAEHVRFCFTTRPDAFDDGGYTLHGAYRSREVAGAGFFALMRLLRHVGHAEPRRRLADDDGEDYSYVLGFRRLPPGFAERWAAFFQGESDAPLGDLACALLDRPAARADAAAVEQDLRALRAFYDDEARPLAEARLVTAFSRWPVAQTERDPLFLRYRAAARA